MSSYKVFIQCNKKQLIGGIISRHSILSNSKRPNEFEIEIMEVENYPQMMKHHGETYVISGKKARWDKNDLQSFTMTRFLPPQLMNFKGRAIVIDPDVFAAPETDMMELFEKDMKGKAILACKADEKKFKTSVMVLDCQKLKHWNWNHSLDEVFAGKRDYRSWMNLELEPMGTVGILEEEWNHYDTLNEKTKLLHYTTRVTQPWKTGLKIDFKYDPGKSRFNFIPRPVLKKIKSILKRGHDIHDKYQVNPDQTQIDFFYKLMQKAVDDKHLTKEFLDKCIEQKYVRSDILESLRF